jgi:peptide/nickel transport system permease protein
MLLLQRLGKSNVVQLYRTNPLLAYGLTIMFFIVGIVVCAPLLGDYQPNEITLSKKLLPPSAEHIFGTNEVGQDIFTQVVYGGRTSLLVGFSCLAFTLLVGVPLGLISGFVGGRWDRAIMRISDLFLAFPPLLLPIVFIALLGPGLLNAMLAVALSWFPWYVRIMRASVMLVKNQPYVLHAQISGVGLFSILRRHVLPNSITPLLVQVSLDFGNLIMVAAGLSFIGIGAIPPTIEWGLMLADSRSTFLTHWWTAVFPGLAMFITVFAFNMIGDGFRQATDPRAG